ncbi:MAG TPA: winged helix DNA-binding domain-containing protein [Streptosporangiaceae bacterium]|nr:winged helix DNA-binding domain-containing protein [Streptosporangiaceae bacterium]
MPGPDVPVSGSSASPDVSASTAIVAERCAAQLLSGTPGATPEEVVTRLLAVQGQDPRGARLAIRARTAGLTAADVDRALTADRSLLITWLNRGTLHLVTAEDYWWLQQLTTPPMETAVARRLEQEGVSADDADKAVGLIDAALAADGPLTRAQLGDVIAATGIRTKGQALVHILARASIRGLIIRGPMIGRQHAFVRVSDWLGAPPAKFGPRRFDRDAAVAELARRFLAGHAPASERDLAKWAGLPLRDARRGLSAIARELRERPDGRAELTAAPAGPAPGLPGPRLLGSFDPLLHGWVDREPLLGSATGIVTVNGLFRPFALVDGRAAGIWSLTGGTVELSAFAPLAEPVAAALDAEADDVVRFLRGSDAGGQRD